jgi:hypothetical protein
VAIFSRHESPPVFADYRKYRVYLQRDFLYRCAYCERSELYLGGEDFFTADHFRPKERFPELAGKYSNLYYCCGKCNGHKWKSWPAEDLERRGFRFADPCLEDMYIHHLEEAEGGTLKALTPCGEYTAQHIRLNRPDLVQWRRCRKRAQADVRKWANLRERLQSLLGTSAESNPGEVEGAIESVGALIIEALQRFNLA